MTNEYTVIEKCRICYNDSINEVLKLEPQYVATTFVTNNENNPMAKIKIPLTLILCKKCGLVQLKETVRPDLLYKNYFYRTAINDTMKRDLQDVVNYAVENVKTEKDDVVVDIGANDCTMLSMYPDHLKKFGIEPATNIDWSHVNKSITIVNNYFSKDTVLKATNGKKAKIISATAVFYDFDDPNIATKDIKDVLHEDGVCVIHGLKIIDATTNFVNGGSLRVLVTHKENSRPKSKRYKEILYEDKKWNLEELDTYVQYEHKIKDIIKKSREFIVNEIENGGTVIGLGASTKGNVLLQICGIGKDLLPYISDRNKEKVGLRTLGTDIEIISEEKAREINPSAMLVIPWNFKEEVLSREKDYIQNGGKMLFLMPRPYFVDKNGEHYLE